MPKFTVIYVKGRVVARGISVEFEALPGKSTLLVETPSRSAAYVYAYEHLSSLGLSIFINHDPTMNANPLGFCDFEIEDIQRSETPLPTMVTSGIRIEKIFRTDN